MITWYNILGVIDTMNSSFRKKTLAVIVICLMMLMSLPVVMGSNEYFVENLDGNILYVGGTGPGNYSKIQDAIDNAYEGDTIYVYSGIYFENVVVDKSIILQGEDRETTVIDGMKRGHVIQISADNVKISGFTIQNGGGDHYFDGIYLISSHNIIENNIIQYNRDAGIEFSSASHNKIIGNHIQNNGYNGISIWGGDIHIFKGFLHIPIYSTNNNITLNVISNNTHSGIYLASDVAKTFIDMNQFENNEISVAPMHTIFNKITRNNFMGSDPFFQSGINEWDSNYWGEPLSSPKKISGRIGYIGWIPWYNYDDHPAQEPYDIGGE